MQKKEEEAERLHEAVVSHEVKSEKEVQQEDDQLCGVQEEKVDWLLNLTLLNGRLLMKISCRYRWHNDVINYFWHVIVVTVILYIMGTDIIDKIQNPKCSENRHLENSC